MKIELLTWGTIKTEGVCCIVCCAILCYSGCATTDINHAFCGTTAAPKETPFLIDTYLHQFASHDEFFVVSSQCILNHS